MTLTRRTFIKSTAAAGALALTRPWGALADTLGPGDEFKTARKSRLFPSTGLLHCDMHNHSMLSDGDGDPEEFYTRLQAAGLDVAALTDHSTIAYGTPIDPCFWGCGGEEALAGIDEEEWARMQALADAANRNKSFIALRGFEWSSPFQGHMNVWFSERWIDPLHTGGGTFGEGGAGFFHEEGVPLPTEFVAAYDEAIRALPTTGAGMVGFYDWLKAAPSRPVLGGGADGLASFNHPGREPGRFGYFKHDPAVAPRVVAMEVFNRREDYLFKGTDNGERSPLNECLNAGWRVGLSGVTDEHSPDWGDPRHLGKGRMGLWVGAFTRDGIRQAIAQRRFFATRLAGLRVDAAAGKRVRMGSVLTHSSGPVRFRLDIDRGPDWHGKALEVQVLRPGASMPEVAANVPVTVPADPNRLISFTVPISIAEGTWVVLRITDPSRPADDRAEGPWVGYGEAVAYTSPWFLVP